MSAHGQAKYLSSTIAVRGVFVALIAAAACLPGCMIVDVGVTNPVRGLRSVAVVPFFNQSAERAADGRQMAELYARELQKTPGVEVIPVGVVETTMRTYGLQNLAGPDDAVKLAALLNADAVVIGTVTEFSPYDPPRVGLSIAWYSPYRMQFDQAVPVDPAARERIQQELTDRRREDFEMRKRHFVESVEGELDNFFEFQPPPGAPQSQPPTSLRPQPIFPDLQIEIGGAGPLSRVVSPNSPPSMTTQPNSAKPAATIRPPTPPTSTGTKQRPQTRPPIPTFKTDSKTFHPPIIEIRGQSPDVRLVTARRRKSRSAPIRPIMSYTKVFDAADSATTAAFRDFLELSGDNRGGDWSARLVWADEFPRFAAHLMIVEMFQLHGGEARRRVVLKWRKHK